MKPRVSNAAVKGACSEGTAKEGADTLRIHRREARRHRREARALPLESALIFAAWTRLSLLADARGSRDLKAHFVRS